MSEQEQIDTLKQELSQLKEERRTIRRKLAAVEEELDSNQDSIRDKDNALKALTAPQIIKDIVSEWEKKYNEAFAAFALHKDAGERSELYFKAHHQLHLMRKIKKNARSFFLDHSERRLDSWIEGVQKSCERTKRDILRYDSDTSARAGVRAEAREQTLRNETLFIADIERIKDSLYG